MITAKELADKLNGRAYGDSFDDVRQHAFSFRSSNICKAVLFILVSCHFEMIRNFADCNVSNSFD